jgi:hypothetical protein
LSCSVSGSSQVEHEDDPSIHPQARRWLEQWIAGSSLVKPGNDKKNQANAQ